MNDLTTISAVETGSAIEDLCRLLYESYGVELICVCQTLYRQDASSFNKQLNLCCWRLNFEPLDAYHSMFGIYLHS